MKPDLPKLFPELKNVNSGQIGTSHALFSHAERVMRAVENAVSALDDAVSFTAYLEELGRRHKVRALKPDYLEVSFFFSFLGISDTAFMFINSASSNIAHPVFLLYLSLVMVTRLSSISTVKK